MPPAAALCPLSTHFDAGQLFHLARWDRPNAALPADFGEGAMRKRPRITASHKEADRRELAAALAHYRGPIKRCPPGGSNKRRPPKPRTNKQWREE
jgi:hypothetical protein